MTRTKEVVVWVCDGCEKDMDWKHPCLRCSKNYCYGCRKKEMVEYPHAVYCSGSGDVQYCVECNAILYCSHDNAIFNAYFKIKSIRKSLEDYNMEMTQKIEDAENDLKALQKR